MIPAMPIPKTNQLDDFREHMKLREKAQHAAVRGHRLLAAGDHDGAQAALDEADDCLERCQLLEERWKR